MEIRIEHWVCSERGLHEIRVSCGERAWGRQVQHQPGASQVIRIKMVILMNIIMMMSLTVRSSSRWWTSIENELASSWRKNDKFVDTKSANKLVIDFNLSANTAIFGVSNIRQSLRWFMSFCSTKNTNISTNQIMMEIALLTTYNLFTHKSRQISPRNISFQFSPNPDFLSSVFRILLKIWSFQNWTIILYKWRWVWTQ